MEEYKLIDFDKNKVVRGASLGTRINGEIVLATRISIYAVSTNMYMGYVIFNNDLNKLFYFDSDGNLYNSDDKNVGVAYIVDSTITRTTGTKIVKKTDSDGSSHARPYIPVSAAAEGEETNEGETTEPDNIFSIATLQPREEVAMSCLNAMLSHYDTPLSIDNTKIKQLVSKSFLFAQEFINQAVLYREKETTSSTAESNKYASIDANSLSSDTDKLLYNIATAITNFIAQDKNQYAEQQKNGLKVNAEVSGTITTKQESGSTGNTENV